MTRYILIAAALLALDPLTDWLVDRHVPQVPTQHGYTIAGVNAVSAIVARESARRQKPARRNGAWTGERLRLGLRTLGWEVAGE